MVCILRKIAEQTSENELEILGMLLLKRWIAKKICAIFGKRNLHFHPSSV